MKIIRLIKTIGLTLIMVAVLAPTSEAQILKELGRSVKRKIGEKIERKVVETLAEEIARRAFRPINDVMDDWIRENMKQDSTYAGLSDDSLAIIMRTNYGKILNGLNQAANLPPSYSFDYTMNIVVSDNGESHPMKWYIQENGDAMAFQQMTGDEDQMMLMDIKNDIIVMYNLKDKTGQALPSMMSMGAAFAAAEIENEAYDPMSRMKKGGTKTVAGYACQEYMYEDEENISNVWISDEVPFDWSSAFGTLVGRVSPKLAEQNSEWTKGMMLESVTKEKGKRKGKFKSVSTWETKSIDSSTFSIDNSKFQFGMDME